MEREGSYKAYITAPKWAHLKEFLYDLSFKSQCDLQILNHDKGFLSETIYFKYSGGENNLYLIQKVINDAMEEYNDVPYHGKSYKVKKAVVEIDDKLNSMTIDIETNKFSHVKELITNISQHMDLNEPKVEEVHHGFLKGKSIKTNVYFSSKKSLNKFLAILENHVIAKNAVVITQKSSLKISP